MGELDIMTLFMERSLGCKRAKFLIKYLGVPIRDRKLKEDWMEMIKKIQKKLECCQGRFLSLGGRIVLFNSILSVIPLYQASVYKIPRWVTTQICKIRRLIL